MGEAFSVLKIITPKIKVKKWLPYTHYCNFNWNRVFKTWLSHYFTIYYLKDNVYKMCNSEHVTRLT